MPYFVGVTPLVVGEPITMSWKWVDGTNKSTRFVLIDDAEPSSAQVSTFAQAKAALSNAGLFKWKGAGQTQEVPQVAASAFDELYSILTVLVCQFQSASDPTLIAYDRIPAIQAELLAGYALDVSGTNPAQVAIAAYIAAAEAMLNTGSAADFAFSGSLLEGVDSELRTLPVVTDPAGSPPAS